MEHDEGDGEGDSLTRAPRRSAIMPPESYHRRHATGAARRPLYGSSRVGTRRPCGSPVARVRGIAIRAESGFCAALRQRMPLARRCRATRPQYDRRVKRFLTPRLAPLSFAFIPVIGMLWIASEEMPPPGISIVRIVLLLAVGALVPYVLLLLRHSVVVASTAVGASLLVLGFYPSAHATAEAAGWNQVAFAWAYLCACIAVGWGVTRVPEAVTRVINDMLVPVAFVFITFAVGLIAREYVVPAPYPPNVQAAMAKLSHPLDIRPTTSWRPDVYDLVLDAMGRPDVLARKYDLVLDSELARWRSLGFDIVPNGHANYAHTELSLTSMLNMAYLDDLATAEAASNARGPLRYLTSNSRVPAAFKRLGYSVEHIGTGYQALGMFAVADHCDCPQLWFANAEVGTLSLSPFQVLSPSVGNAAHYSRCLAVFSHFERPRDGGDPRYVFAHVSMPHPPFLTDEQGRFNHSRKALATGDGPYFLGTREEYRAGYKAQAAFAVSRAFASVRRILQDEARQGRDAIIVVHGDHGPRLGFDPLTPSVEAGRDTLPVFLAIYWPRGHEPEREPESLVNVYRVIFRDAFGADLPPLADRAYVSGFRTPYLTTLVPGLEGRPASARASGPAASAATP